MLLALLPASAAGQNCPASHYDEHAIVRKVHDGDTLWLEDGRKIRLIGINAPELARDEKPAEAFAIDAREYLKQRLQSSSNQVRLVFGEQRSDRYQRSLAHVFLPDGSNLQAELVENGLAMAITYPPNTAFSSCYHPLEQTAHCEQKGLWSSALANIQQSTALDSTRSGFHIISGKVERVQASGKGVWLWLQGGLMLGVHHAELPYFDRAALFALEGQSVRVRGWLHPKNSQHPEAKFYMRLRHPSALAPAQATDNIPKC